MKTIYVLINKGVKAMTKQKSIVDFEEYKNTKEIENTQDLSSYLYKRFFQKNVPVALQQSDLNQIIELSQGISNFQNIDLYDSKNNGAMTDLWFVFVNYVLPNITMGIGLNKFYQHQHAVIIKEYTLNELVVNFLVYPFDNKENLCCVTGSIYFNTMVVAEDKQYSVNLRTDLKDKNIANGPHYEKAMETLINNHRSYAEAHDWTYSVKDIDGELYATSIVDYKRIACPTVLMTTVQPCSDTFNTYIEKESQNEEEELGL